MSGWILIVFHVMASYQIYKSNKMFFCNGKVEDKKQPTIFNSPPEPCSKHNNKPIKFICKDCTQAPLICSDCINDHSSHNWINYQEFFTEEIMDVLKSGCSNNGKNVDEQVQRLIDFLLDYSTRIQQKLKELEIKIIDGLENFKKKFPKYNNCQLRGNRINNKNMSNIIKIVESERNYYSCQRLKRTFKQILEASEEIINDNFKRIEKSLEGSEWEKVQKNELAKIEKEYLSHFGKQPKYGDFHFAQGEKNPAIEIEGFNLVAKFAKEIPKKPAALVDKFLCPQNNEIIFKVTKMPKSWMFFDSSTIYIGACIPEIAENYQYLNLTAPSHGGYFISSAGRCFHTKLPQFQNQSSSFTFGENDSIKVGVDFNLRAIKFYKKGSMNKFQMPLSLDNKYIQKLRPCIMFSEQEGAEVKIVNMKKSIDLSETQSARNSRKMSKRTSQLTQ